MSGKATLTLGKRAKFVLQYFDDLGPAGIELYWSHPNQDMTLIPYKNFFTTAVGSATPVPTATPKPSVTPSPTPIPVVTPVPSISPNLVGKYFNNKDFTSSVTSRQDSTINFDWGIGQPISGVGADTFSVRWTGYIKAAVSDTYTFYTNADSGIRFWINNQLIVDDWVLRNGVIERSGTFYLRKGEVLPVKVEYFEDTGSAVVKLFWSSSTISKQPIPAGIFFH